MSFVRVNKNNAWSCWQQGLIAGGNASMADVDQTFALLGANKGLNALRLFLNYSDDGYWLVPTDYVAIGNNGWNQTIATTLGQRNPAISPIRTYADVAQKLQQVMDNCGSVGMGVILTLGFWQNTSDRMWVSKEADSLPTSGWREPDPYTEATTPEIAQQYLINFWRATATRFGTHPALIGYDILNEPVPAVHAAWASLANRVVDAIRAVDTATPVIVEGTDYGNNLKCFFPDSPTTGAPVPDALITYSAPKKVVFSMHAYSPVGATHNGLADWAYESMGMPYPPAEAWNLTTGVKAPINTAAQLAALYYQHIITFKRTYKVPVFVGEFSYINQSGSPQYYEPEPDNAHRLVTRIRNAPTGGVEVHMGRLDSLGFRIDYAPDTAGVYENTVRLTVQKLPANLRDSTIDAATYDQWDAIVTSLGIVDKEVTVKPAGKSYVVQIPGITQVIEPAGATTPVALISLKPSVQHQSMQAASRKNYAKHIVRICQDEGFSWAWHALEKSPRWWNPTTDVMTVLRDGAMGRKIIA